MNEWIVGAIALLATLVPCSVVCLRAGRSDRLVALELATVVAILTLVMLAEGLGRPSDLDVALMLALLAFPGSLAFAVTLERWL